MEVILNDVGNARIEIETDHPIIIRIDPSSPNSDDSNVVEFPSQRPNGPSLEDFEPSPR